MDAHPTAKTTTPQFNKKFNDFLSLPQHSDHKFKYDKKY